MNNMTLQHITLRDDGTLDTVVDCECPLCEEELTYRFSQDGMDAYGGDVTLAATEAWEGECCGIDH